MQYRSILRIDDRFAESPMYNIEKYHVIINSYLMIYFKIV